MRLPSVLRREGGDLLVPLSLGRANGSGAKLHGQGPRVSE
jgi:hypothetical protein